MSHANISVFVPHIGCPNQCSFCNQYCITGHTAAPTADDVRSAVEVALSSGGTADGREIAFFGGSFTAIERGYMTELLSAAKPFVDNGSVSGIRVSTRPDAIDSEVLTLLAQYGVTAVELGAQCMNDRVLSLNRRGHTAADVYDAAKLIRERGFELGLQMMTGLYGSDDPTDTDTARQFITIGADTVRIYPTVVLRDTYLEHLMGAGEYVPQTVDDAASLCARLTKMLESSGIRVIRVGLHTVDEGSYIGGPWHPAFGEICRSYIYRQRIAEGLHGASECTVYVAPTEVSKAIGQKRSNIEYFRTKGCNVLVKGDGSLKNDEIRIEEATN